MSDRCQESPVLHVVVVGFHHKKGCQVEYSYPPLVEGNDVNCSEVPKEWKHLASLAIPDGAHNYTKDTIYFHLPSRDGACKTVYGVACYRQIESSALMNKSSDVTRSTVQKSVCVLSRLPLYGLIQAKLELITHAYFDELDFSKVELLEDTYKNLSLSMTESLRDGTQVFLGMSVRDVVTQFRHKIVLLFKLILLERRVLFTGAPVQTLCNTILAVLSLFPGMIEFGLEESATVELNRQLSPTLRTTSSDGSEEFLEVCYHDEKVNYRSPKKDKQAEAQAAYNEPEQLEIPRDGMEPSSTVKSQLKPQPTSQIFDNTSDNQQTQGQEVTPRALRSLSDTAKENSGRESKSGRSLVKRTLSESFALDYENQTKSEGSSSPSDNKVPFSHDPLANMRDITQLTAIQSGTKLKQTDSVVNVEEFKDYLEKLETMSDEEKESSKFELSLNLEDAREVLKRSEGIEELDSPESILKIDQEDCFSWEEDRLLLAIEHKDSISEAEASRQQNNQSDSTKESCDTQDSGKEVGSPNVGAQKITTSDSIDSENTDSADNGIPTSDVKKSPGNKAAILKNRISSAISGLKTKRGSQEPSPTRENSPVEMGVVLRSSKLHQDDCGFPLAVFTKGCVCHPYLSLQYLDLMTDVNVRSFVIGATNFLFRQKRHLSDIVIEVSDSEEGKIEIHDRELQRLLHLTTADLRFADIIIKAVLGEDTDDPYLDGTEWEGGDEWIQAQFRAYLQSLLVTMEKNDSKLLEDYGTAFCQAYRTTHNFKQWWGTDHSGLTNVLVGHPCQGHLGMSDIKMRLAHNLQNTERGKKINAAMVQTGKYVEQAGKAVGGAIVNARSAVSSWFSGWRQSKGDNLQPQSQPQS